MGAIDPAGPGEADPQTRYELTNLVRHYTMEPAGRAQLRPAERVALVAVGALVADAPNTVLGDFEDLLPELCAAIDEALALADDLGPTAVFPTGREAAG